MGDEAMEADGPLDGGRSVRPRFSIFAALRRMAANTEGVTDVDWDAGMCELVDGAATRCFDRQIAPFAARFGGIVENKVWLRFWADRSKQAKPAFCKDCKHLRQ